MGKLSAFPSFRKRRGIAADQYRARYVDSSGKEHTRRFQYKQEAVEWLKHVTRRGLDIAPPVTGAWTVADQFAQWIRKRDIAETTRAAPPYVKRPLQERWGHVQVTAVDPPGVKSWVADLVDKATGVPTIENALGVLRTLMADALSDHRLIRNPCDGVRAPKRKHKRREYLDHPQVEQLATAVAGRDGFIVRFKAYTGLRWGELAALTVGAVDLKRRRLQINGSYAEAGGQVVWKAPKDHERRSVPFPAFLLSDLKGALAGKGRDDLVFQAPQGGVLRISLWRPRVFNPARDSLGADFPRITPHDLRHTAASLVVSGGGNVLALARMLGHQSPKETLET